MRARSAWRGGRKSNVSGGGSGGGEVSVDGRMRGVWDVVEGWRLWAVVIGVAAILCDVLRMVSGEL
jgi:hypothetical protein